MLVSYWFAAAPLSGCSTTDADSTWPETGDQLASVAQELIPTYCTEIQDDCVDRDLVNPAHIYMAPPGPNPGDGSDSNDGSSEQPFASLQRAHNEIASKGAQDYHVHVHGGTYLGQYVLWDTFYPGHRVLIEAVEDETPVFNGEGKLYRLFRNVGSGSGNITIRGLTITRYANIGISLGTDCNRIENNVFTKIGSKYGECEGGYIIGTQEVCRGYSGISVFGAHANRITGNVMSYLENVDPYLGLIHAVYFDGGGCNYVGQNAVSHVMGDPVKFRDGANDNLVESNRIEHSGRRSFVLDWPSSGEAYSCNNEVRDNYFLFQHPRVRTLDGLSPGPILPFLVANHNDCQPLAPFIIGSNQLDSKHYQGLGIAAIFSTL